MKRILLIVIAAVTLAACNNSKPNHTHAAHTAKEDEETSSVADKTKSDTVGAADTTAQKRRLPKLLLRQRPMLQSQRIDLLMRCTALILN
ncbi:MAG: hypothetical protein ACN6ON_08745 [Sphingobacterium sp.]